MNTIIGTSFILMKSKSVYVGDKMDYDIKNGVLYSYKGSDRSVIIPDEVVTIAENAFSGSEMEEVLIPFSVMTVGEGAFSECRSLKSVTIEDGVEILDDYAFENCRSIRHLSIPESVRKIGNFCFRGCSMLTAPALDPSVDVGFEAFNGCFSEVNQPATVSVIQDTIGEQSASLSNASGYSTDLTDMGVSSVDDLKRVGYGVYDAGLNNSGQKTSIDSIDDIGQLTSGSSYIPSGQKDMVDVILFSYGDSKNALINGLKEKLYLSVSQAVSSTRKVPSSILCSIPKKTGEEVVSGITGAGGIAATVPAAKGVEIDDNTLVIPEGVKIIYPFEYAYRMNKCVVIPKSVIRIEKHAFAESDIEEVVFLGNPDEINLDKDAFLKSPFEEEYIKSYRVK